MRQTETSSVKVRQKDILQSIVQRIVNGVRQTETMIVKVRQKDIVQSLGEPSKWSE